MNKKLETYRRRKSLVTIRRDDIDENALDGFILGFSAKFILLAKVYDFIMDGWLVLNRKFVTGVKSTQSDRYCKSILKHENALASIHPDLSIDLSDYPSLFSSLKRAHAFIIVENERPGANEFLIGPIARINKSSVSIRYFDACGKWIEGSHRISFDAITCVQFGCNYIKIHRKYITGGPSGTIGRNKRT